MNCCWWTHETARASSRLRVRVNVSSFETHLVRNGQQSSVQLLHQLLECRSLSGNGVPAFTHHHVATEKTRHQELSLEHSYSMIIINLQNDVGIKWINNTHPNQKPQCDPVTQQPQFKSFVHFFLTVEHRKTNQKLYIDTLIISHYLQHIKSPK